MHNSCFYTENYKPLKFLMTRKWTRNVQDLTIDLGIHGNDIVSLFQEVISRKVLLDEGSRQIVEVEQAAIWKFLWWSGIVSVHVFVDQNRKNHTVKT